MRRIAAAALLGLCAGALLAALPFPAGADPSSHTELGSGRELYRAPWRERLTHYVDGGCQNGGTVKDVPDSDCEGGHTGSDHYAIDFGTFGCSGPGAYERA